MFSVFFFHADCLKGKRYDGLKILKIEFVLHQKQSGKHRIVVAYLVPLEVTWTHYVKNNLKEKQSSLGPQLFQLHLFVLHADKHIPDAIIFK